MMLAGRKIDLWGRTSVEPGFRAVRSAWLDGSLRPAAQSYRVPDRPAICRPPSSGERPV